MKSQIIRHLVAILRFNSGPCFQPEISHNKKEISAVMPPCSGTWQRGEIDMFFYFNVFKQKTKYILKYSQNKMISQIKMSMMHEH